MNDKLARISGARQAFDNVTEPKKCSTTLTMDFDKIADPFVMPGDVLCAATPTALNLTPPSGWTKNGDEKGWTLWYHVAIGRGPYVFSWAFYDAIDFPPCPYVVLRPNPSSNVDEEFNTLPTVTR